jgi:tight adherence protein B
MNFKWRARALASIVAALFVIAPTAPAASQLQVRIREAALDPDGRVRLIASVAGTREGQVLDKRNFKVTEEGDGVESFSVESLLESKVQPVAVALVMDVSGSTKGRPLADAKSAATALLGSLPSGIQTSLIAFGTSASTIVDFTGDRNLLVQSVQGLVADGDTALYDAVALAASSLEKIQGQRNMIVFSDGADTHSLNTLDGAIEAAKAAKIQIASIALVSSEFDPAPLERLSAETGGSSIQANKSGELGAAFDQASREIRSQYVLTYTGQRSAPKELDLKVTLAVDGSEASDSIVALNPRIDAPQSEPALQAATGPITSKVFMYLGVVASFGALLLLFLILFQRTGGNRALRALRGETASKPQNKKEMELSSLTQRAVDMVEQLPKPKGYEDKLHAKIERAGWAIRSGEFLTLQAATAVVGAVFGFGLFSHWFLGILLTILGAALPRVILARRIQKRANAFLAQLPETLQLLAASLQAGYGLLQAVDTVVKESEPPTSTEFARVLTEARLGMSLEDALEGMADRLGSEDFRWVVLAINIQRQVGGNLAVVLQTVADTLREREQLRRQVKTLSAEGRLSALILTVLPFLLVVYLRAVNPSYLELLTGTGIGKFMLFGVLMFMTIGILWMKKIIRIKV